MRSKLFVFTLLILFLTINLIIVDESGAIPAFARRYKISCNTCHAPFPKLKPYGDEFAGNGFIIVEDEQERDYVTAGDELLWLNKEFPLAVRFDAYAHFDQDQEVEKDLQIPWGLKLMSGGTLYKSIGYYFYFYMSERGEVAGIEDAYIHFDNVFSTPLDIMVGQFQTSDPLMKRELRLTFEDYVFYKTRFGHSGTNLAYDRGIMLVYGIEKTGTDLIAFVVNGNGKDEAGDDLKFDNDDYKNFGFRISEGIGDFMSIGAYFYQGKEKEVGSQLKNEITYWGPDINVSVGPLEFTGQYLERKDTNPLFADDATEFDAKGYIAELIYAPQLDRSRFYFTGLYNKIESDLYPYETATLSGTYLLSRNLRLIAEYTRDIEYEVNRMTFGLTGGF
ncbi:hypothetical protein JXB12_01300 [candidate division KSB1 bacterium]|nr:hypothetical protein [candidate division KSB1 bacterium]